MQTFLKKLLVFHSNRFKTMSGELAGSDDVDAKYNPPDEKPKSSRTANGLAQVSVNNQV